MKRELLWIAALVVVAGIVGWLLRNKVAAMVESATTSADKLLWPVPGHHVITSFFGMRTHPVTGVRKLHNGIDIGAPTGTPIVSPWDGTVSAVSDTTAGGKQVTILHTNGVTTGYAHLSERVVRNAQVVKRGQVIGKVGATGQVTGPHLHFTVTDPFGEKLDPKPLLT